MTLCRADGRDRLVNDGDVEAGFAHGVAHLEKACLQLFGRRASVGCRQPLVLGRADEHCEWFAAAHQHDRRVLGPNLLSQLAELAARLSKPIVRSTSTTSL